MMNNEIAQKDPVSRMADNIQDLRNRLNDHLASISCIADLRSGTVPTTEAIGVDTQKPSGEYERIALIIGECKALLDRAKAELGRV